MKKVSFNKIIAVIVIPVAILEICLLYSEYANQMMEDNPFNSMLYMGLEIIELAIIALGIRAFNLIFYWKKEDKFRLNAYFLLLSVILGCLAYYVLYYPMNKLLFEILVLLCFTSFFHIVERK